MKQTESLSDSLYTRQMHLAERELSAFIAAVAELFGADQARVSAEDWLDESELIDGPPRSTTRDWRTITISASARLANRLARESNREQESAQEFTQSCCKQEFGGTKRHKTDDFHNGPS